LDEASPSDADYASTTGYTSLALKMQTLNDPGFNNGHTLYVRASSPDSSKVLIELYQGGTGAYVSSWVQQLSSTPTTYRLALTAAQAAVIDRYWDLRVKITQSAEAAPFIRQGIKSPDPTSDIAHTCTATFTSAPYVGNTLVVFVSEQSSEVGTTMAVSDNKGNVYTPLGSIEASDSYLKVFAYITQVQSTGAGFAITANSSTPGSWNPLGMSVIEAENVSSLTPDAFVTSTGDGYNRTANDAIPITTSFDRALILACWFTWDSAFTSIPGWAEYVDARMSDNWNWGFNFVAYLRTAVSGTYTPYFTVASNGSTDSIGVALALKGF
jgi:Tfp pilus assembly protein PilX